MNAQYWDDVERNNDSALENDLERVRRLWDIVYSRIESALSDIEAGRPTIEEDEAKTPEEYRHSNELREEREISILRECCYEIVQAAILALR